MFGAPLLCQRSHAFTIVRRASDEIVATGENLRHSSQLRSGMQVSQQFAYPRDREMMTSGVTQSPRALDVTAHCQKMGSRAWIMNVARLNLMVTIVLDSMLTWSAGNLKKPTVVANFM